MNEYLNDAILIGRRVKAAYDQPVRVTHHNPWMKEACKTAESNEDEGATTERTVFRDYDDMDFALVAPVGNPAEGPAVDWKALKVKNPSLERVTEEEKLEFLRSIAEYLLNIAEEQDRAATGVHDMNIEQWQEYVTNDKERVNQIESEIKDGAGAVNMPGNYN